MAFTTHDPRRVFSRILTGHKFGDATEVTTIHATTEDGLASACAYYESTNVPPGNTDLRIDRAIYMHETFDAEARHELVLRSASAIAA